MLFTPKVATKSSSPSIIDPIIILFYGPYCTLIQNIFFSFAGESGSYLYVAAEGEFEVIKAGKNLGRLGVGKVIILYPSFFIMYAGRPGVTNKNN